ncbi:MAG: nucleotidyltransferase family protein [Nanoarchaeota archaeon]
MAYTEIKARNDKKYFYRVLSVRNGKKISKKRKYLGVNLSKNELLKKEKRADENLGINSKKNNELEKIKQKIIEILKKNKIKKAGIFGSYARDEQKNDSDIDVLIQPTKEMSLLDLSGLKIELEEALNRKVDLVSYNYIHPYLKKKILNNEIRII